MTQVGSALVVASNPALLSVSLTNLLGVGEAVSITSNSMLETIDLQALVTVDGSLTVADNFELLTIDLASLQSVPVLNVSGNPELTSLGTLQSLTDVGQMTIAGNASLPQCEVDAIEARLGACTACSNNDEQASCN
jgi:hypothetical protein